MVNMRSLLALSVLSLLAQAVPSPTQAPSVTYLQSGSLDYSGEDATKLHQFQKRQTCYTFFFFWRWCFADDDDRDIVTTTFGGQAVTVTLNTPSVTSSSAIKSSTTPAASSAVSSSMASSRASSSTVSSTSISSSSAPISSSPAIASSSKASSSSVASSTPAASSSTASSSAAPSASSSSAAVSSTKSASSSSTSSSSISGSIAPSSVASRPIASSSITSSSIASSASASSAIASSSSASSISSSSRASSSVASTSSGVSSGFAVSSSTLLSSSAIPTTLSIPLQISSVVSSVVSSAIPTPSSKWTSPTLPTGWVTVPGCIAEAPSARALTGSTYSSASMTPEACIAYCNVNGYRLAGVEYGSECYCGDDYSNGAAPSLLSTACDMPCSGDVNKLCAGPSALMIYSNSLFVAPKLNLPAGWAPSDPLCIAEVPGRALTGSYWSADNMTVDICVSYCSGIGFPYAAVEYGRECFCGTQLVNGASFDKTSTACNMPCAGSPSSNRQICGGSNALSVYFNSGYVSKLVLPTGWESLGCIAEGTQGRALISAQWESDSMTIGACLSYCSTRGYGMAGLEYGRQCFCAKDSLSNGASLAVTSNQCTMPCSGSILLPCGGPYALDLYQNPSIAKAVNEVTSAVGSWKDSKLCLQEVVGRALRGAAVSSPGMNVEYCLNYCGGLGFILAGVEYGNECYCGQKLEGGASLSLQSGECKMPCAGNTTQICGGPNAINFYSTDAINVTVTLPTGWSKIGCVAEPNGHRALNVSAFDVSPIQGSFMTGVACARACSNAGYALAATQYSQECRCGNALDVTALSVINDNNCNFPCSGNLQEMCGGAYMQTLFSSKPSVPLVKA